MRTFKKGEDYTYDIIQKEEDLIQWEMFECGTEEFVIGQHFIILRNLIKDECISFVLTGHLDTRGSIYTCIYNDLK